MKRNLIVIGIILYSLNTIAQDTIVYQQDTITKNELKYNKILKYFLTDRNEVKHLWKLDLLNSAFLKPSISFEQKLGKRWSFLIGASINTGAIGTIESLFMPYRDYKRYNNLQLNTITELRFYHNLNKRNLKGKNTNGFSANYISLGINTYSNFNKDTKIIMGENLNTKILSRKFSYYGTDILTTLDINYGIQRRIGNVGYIDIQAGWGVGKAFRSKSDCIFFIPKLKLEIGFGVQCKRKRKQKEMKDL